MKAWPYRPGVPAAGHITYKGYWHPGRIEGCPKCKPYDPPKRRQPNQRNENGESK